MPCKGLLACVFSVFGFSITCTSNVKDITHLPDYTIAVFYLEDKI